MRFQMIAMLAGWEMMAALSLALPADAQQTEGAKGDAVLPETDPGANQSFEKKRGIKVEWEPFNQFDELINNSHLIIRGKVMEQSTVTQGIDKEVPLTVSTVAVNRVVRTMADVTSVSGEEVKAGERIQIVELGGRLADGSMLEPDAAPVLREGDEVLFFLRSQQIDLKTAGQGKPGAYHVTGGFQGRWSIRDGRVHPLGLQSGRSGFLDSFDGRLVEAVVKELKEMKIKPKLFPDQDDGAIIP